MREFRIEVPESELDDLRSGSPAPAGPRPATVGGWTQGVPLDYARELCAYWAGALRLAPLRGRAQRVPQFRTGLDGGADDTVDVHLIHARSRHANALPLLLTHGWPGSVIEFLDVIDEP